MVSKKDLTPRVGILTGPTATGKSGLAISLAQEHGNVELINADSLLVYRGLDIGTAKPTKEELTQVPHHLIDILDPSETFTAGQFQRAALAAIQEIHSRNKRALIVGGAGFYLKALLYGLWETPQEPTAEVRARLRELTLTDLYQQLNKIDPESALRIGPKDQYRLIRALEIFQTTGQTPTELQSKLPPVPDPTFQLWILDRDNAELHKRIHLRTQLMLNRGLVDEFKKTYDRFPESRALKAVGYAQVGDYLKGIRPEGRKIRAGEDGLQDEIDLATRQLVKRQRTWFRGQCPASSPRTEWFLLDQERSRLEEAFRSVYQ